MHHTGLVLVSALLVLAASLGAAERDDVAVDQQSAAVAAELQAMVAMAAAAEAESAFAVAAEWYQKALAVRPGYEPAREGLVRVTGVLNGALDNDGLAAEADVQRQLAQVEIKVALKRAELLAADGRFEAARKAVQSARFQLERHPEIDQAAQLEAVLETIARLRIQAGESLEAEARAERQEAQRKAIAEVQVQVDNEQNSFDVQLVRIVDLKQRAHYEVALAQARDLVGRYPDERRAELLFGELLRLAHQQRKLTTEERMKELKLELNERITRSMVPAGFDGTPQFPTDWFERRAGRTSTLIGDITVPEWELALRDRLSARMDVDFENEDVIQALEFVGQEAGVNLVIDVELRAAGGFPATLRLYGTRVDNIISHLSRQAGATWTLKNEAVWIGGDTARDTVVQAYDVTEFMYSAPDQPSLGLGMFSVGGDESFDIFGADTAFGDEGTGIAPEDLVDLIQVAVAPEAWDANPDYGIVIRNNWLIVTAPSNVHVLINEFMRSQAAANNVLVRLNLSWLDIQDDFFEEIGMDWNDVGQNLLRSPFNAGFVESQEEFAVSGQLQNQLPSSAVNLGQGNMATGLSLQWVQLAFPFISAIFRAEQRSKKARVLDGLELTTLNGVQSSAFFGRQIAYISDYEVAAGGNLDPVIDILNVGQSIDIRPFVSADRKYVTLDVTPSIASATFFTENLTAETIAGRGPGGGGVATINTFPLELPNVFVRSASTRVMIPDRGAVLVGGFGQAIEQYAETQIPILGHIPFLGRLFGMRGQYSSRSQLYLSVQARIILYTEEEANL